MQKYVKDNIAIGLDKFDRYLSDSDTVDFLAITTSASSIAKLL